mgnify:CR=1 FL=1
MEQLPPDASVLRTIETLRSSIWKRRSADAREGLEDRRRIFQLKQTPSLKEGILPIEATLAEFERTLVDPDLRDQRSEIKAKLISQIDQLLAKLRA